METRRGTSRRAGSRARDGRGEADELVLDQDELVPRQCFDRLLVELGQSARALGDRAQSPRAPLSEGALERALLAGGLEAAASRRAARRERTDFAARYARDANRCAEVHQRLRAGVVEAAAGPLEHP